MGLEVQSVISNHLLLGMWWGAVTLSKCMGQSKTMPYWKESKGTA